MSSFTMTQEQEQILSSYITPKYPMRVSFKSGEEFEEGQLAWLATLHGPISSSD